MDTKRKQKRSRLHEFGSFILHVTRLIPHPPNSSNHQRRIGDSSLLMLSSPTYEPPMSGDDQEVVVDDLGFDMDDKRIVGSCNGLVCIRDHHQYHSESVPIVVSLWNPLTRQAMNLPESIPIPGGLYSLFVFGFDVEAKDYKVVRFTSLKPRCNGIGSEYCFCRVQLYSLSTNSWRLLEGIPCLPGHPFDYQQSVVYLNNNGTTSTCFFLARFFYTKVAPCLPENDRFVISFDFTKEEIITPIQLPDHHQNQDLCLCSLGHDKLALFTSTNPDDARIRSCQDFNIWVLNYERGSSSSSSSVNKESWEKLYSFQLQLESPVKWNWYTPSGISNDGKFAILATGYGSKMSLYNFATKKVESNFLSCFLHKSKAHAFKPSLDRLLLSSKAAEMVGGGEQQQDGVIENSATNL